MDGLGLPAVVPALHGGMVVTVTILLMLAMRP